MSRHRADRADRERMVTPHQDRQPVRGEIRIDRIVDQPIPGRDFRQMTIAMVRREHGIEGPAEIALVPDVGHEAGDGLDQAGHAQRFGPHVRAANAGADVGGGADDADRMLLHGAELTPAATACEAGTSRRRQGDSNPR
jgi:hypothetical protein